MDPYTVTRDTNELLFQPSSDKVKFWQWTERGGEWSTIPSSKLLNFTQEPARGQDATQTYSASVLRESEEIVVIPLLEGINKQHPALTSKARTLLRTFWAIVVSKALQTSFPVTKTVIAVFNDKTEDRVQLVLQLFTEVNATQAVAFWESLESNIQDWIRRLDNSSRLFFIRNISLRVHWK